MDQREGQVAPGDYMLAPGYICFPSRPARLSAVVGAGAVLAVWDRKRKRGGMTHFSRPYREPGGRSTAKYAAPAIVTLVRMFLDSGSVPADLETHLFGGAENAEAEGYAEGLGPSNVQVALEILEKLRITRVQADTGGNRGRKVVFNSGTGEVILAKVERIRSTDWYPQ